MIRSRFVHLHVHSEFSLIDGLVKIEPLMEILPKKGMNAIAITDYCNLFAAVKVFQAAIKAGIKPILGCDIPYYDPQKPQEVFSLVLLCQNALGYRNLTRLVSRAYQEGQYQGQPRIHRDWIKEHAEGLIALSGASFGDIGKAILAEDEVLAAARAKAWDEIFPGRFYLEIQRTNRAHESAYNEALIQLAQTLSLPLVATNDVRFLHPEDFNAHEARVCIHDGCTLADPKRVRGYSAKQYLRSAVEMENLFSDLPQALQNTVEITKRCTVKLELGKNHLPNFPVPAGSSVEAHLTELARSGLKMRLSLLSTQLAVYEKRLQVELEVINSMGFAGYFLIVADFIRWAKLNDIPVGPGRGSGAGSLVAYVLNITDLDPLQYDLLFERFLNPERVSMPDFDIDFCVLGRDRVIDYVAEKYGRQSVSQIITFGTMAAKAVVRDVGRVLGHAYGFVDKLAKLIPFEIGMTLDKALQQEPELKKRYEQDEEVKELFDLALKLEGISRNAGKHAGGVVIAPSELTDFTAIYCEQGSTQLVSQFDKDDVEAAGLVKFDFLGLRTLTIIHSALSIINAGRKQQGLDPVLIEKIPLEDDETFTLLKACHTTAVFQLESRGMKELIHNLQPDCFEDIIALVALFRPGPLQSGMVEDFINRKHGRAKVEYLHPELEPILKTTYGVILYQEQVIKIAQVLGGFTLGSADLLRRAMGKKKSEEMANQRAAFLQGAVERGVNEAIAAAIFDLMEKFAGYGFNKSHSAAYALVAYQTAWLKAHYPAAFMAAVLSSDIDNTDKVVIFMQESKRMNLNILPPSVNSSYYAFTVRDEKNIIYGLGAIKGLGEAALQAIIQEREKHGPFEGLFSLCKRLDTQKVNRRVLESLIKSGAMDDWGVERAVLIASLDNALSKASNYHLNQSTGQQDLFALFEECQEQEDYIAQVKSWSEQQRLQNEKETLGCYLTGHPASAYQMELKDVTQVIAQLHVSQRKANVCGLATNVRHIVTKRGKKMLIIALEDATGRLDIIAFPEAFMNFSIQTGMVLVVEGELSEDKFTGGVRMAAQTIYGIEEARTRLAKRLLLILKEQDKLILPALQSILKQHPGMCAVQIQYSNHEAQALLSLSEPWGVALNEQLRSSLVHLLDENRVVVCY